MDYIYYQKPNNSNVRVTIGGRLTSDGFLIAVARCSEKDNFVKKEGRALVTDRLNKKQIYKKINIKDMSGSVFVALAKDLAGQVSKVKNCKFC